MRPPFVFLILTQDICGLTAIFSEIWVDSENVDTSPYRRRDGLHCAIVIDYIFKCLHLQYKRYERRKIGGKLKELMCQ